MDTGAALLEIGMIRTVQGQSPVSARCSRRRALSGCGKKQSRQGRQRIARCFNTGYENEKVILVIAFFFAGPCGGTEDAYPAFTIAFSPDNAEYADPESEWSDRFQRPDR